VQPRKGKKALDIAKGLIDYGYHPPTIYFPLVVQEAMLIEPTETESKETLDDFVGAMLEIAETKPEGPRKRPDPPPPRAASTRPAPPPTQGQVVRDVRGRSSTHPALRRAQGARGAPRGLRWLGDARTVLRQKAEHAAVRERAGLFDVSHMGEGRLPRPDARPPSSASSPRRGSAGARPGRLRGGLLRERRHRGRRARLQETEDFLVVVNAANREKDVAHFREHTRTSTSRSPTSPTTGRCSPCRGPRRSASWATSPTRTSRG
jgi:hypothetical protein